MTDEQKEALIALYLVREFSGGKYCSGQTQETLSKTTPYPEMARDLLQLVRTLDKQEALFGVLNKIHKNGAQP